MIKAGAGYNFGMVRLESSVAPRFLTLSDSWMSVPAMLQDFRPGKDLSLLGVPNRMATDFVGLRAMPFSQNQMRRECTTQVQKCLGCNWLAKEQHRVACHPRTAAKRLGVN